MSGDRPAELSRQGWDRPEFPAFRRDGCPPGRPGVGSRACPRRPSAALRDVPNEHAGDARLPCCVSRHWGLFARVLAAESAGAKHWPRTAFRNWVGTPGRRAFRQPAVLAVWRCAQSCEWLRQIPHSTDFSYRRQRPGCRFGSARRDWLLSELAVLRLWPPGVVSELRHPCQSTSRRESGHKTRRAEDANCAGRRKTRPASAPSPMCRVCSGTATDV